MAYRSHPCSTVGQREKCDSGGWEDAQGLTAIGEACRKQNGLFLPSVFPIGADCLRLAKSLLPGKREKECK